jgi:tripartite-type tricarboxylate transporter receptor subunit TctC
MAATRQPGLENVPAITELGSSAGEKAFVKIIATGGEFGRSMAGPPKMPKHLVAAWDKAFAATIADPAFRADVAKRKSPLNPLNGAQLTKVVLGAVNLPKAEIEGARKIYAKLFNTKK